MQFKNSYYISNKDLIMRLDHLTLWCHISNYLCINLSIMFIDLYFKTDQEINKYVNQIYNIKHNHLSSILGTFSNLKKIFFFSFSFLIELKLTFQLY